MRQIQEVDDDLRIASSHISEGIYSSVLINSLHVSVYTRILPPNTGTKNLRHSRAKLVRDTLEIPYKRRRRARLGVLMKMLKSIQGTANTERNVEMFLKRGQYPDAVRCVR